MKYSVALLVRLWICMMLLSICAVGMALSGGKDMDMSNIYPGVLRQAFISGSDEPESSVTYKDDIYVNTYTIDRIFDSSL